MKQLLVNTPSNSYELLVGSGLLPHCGAELAKRIAPCVVALIADDTVDQLYGKQVAASLAAAGFTVHRISFLHGEASKNLETLSMLLETLAEHRLTRSDLIIALGGGVVGDMAGFAAAVYHRGIRFVQMPTSLLAMIDSSVGGKTAIDLKAGKNLAGAFWQPSLVICDTDLLKSLPEGHLLDGLGEMVKYGMGFDATLLAMLHKNGLDQEIEALVIRCIKIKIKLVEADERDEGMRQTLNLGHTVAHAIEICSKLSISHGRAVALGTLIVARACARRGKLPLEALIMLEETLERCGLSFSCPFSATELAAAALLDKKRRGDQITLVQPTEVGCCTLHTISVDALCDFLEDGLRA